ncbi:MAG TPA: hypothetical protein VKA85_08375 [Candidatus Limnocylindrales bacterium]|nr:hypothetical protein [Candidatus Limnocylindrales bacterium]
MTTSQRARLIIALGILNLVLASFAVAVGAFGVPGDPSLSAATGTTDTAAGATASPPPGPTPRATEPRTPTAAPATTSPATPSPTVAVTSTPRSTPSPTATPRTTLPPSDTEGEPAATASSVTPAVGARGESPSPARAAIGDVHAPRPERDVAKSAPHPVYLPGFRRPLPPGWRDLSQLQPKARPESTPPDATPAAQAPRSNDSPAVPAAIAIVPLVGAAAATVAAFGGRRAARRSDARPTD